MPNYNTKYTARYGGDGGSEFTDTCPDLAGRGKIRQIFIRCGEKVDKLTTVFADGTSISHGGNGGSLQPAITFDDDEYVVEVKLRRGEKLDQITFITNKEKDNVYGPYGGTGGSSVTVPLDGYLQYFAGRSGEKIDEISFAYGDKLPPKDVTITKSTSKGSSSGNSWDDLALLNQVVQPIQKISIRHDSEIHQIMVTYADGSFTHGGSGGSKGPDFVLNSSEYITRVDLYTSSQVNGLQFTLNSGRKSIWYGSKSGDSSYFEADPNNCICAFFGRSDDKLYALGVYYASRVTVKVVVTALTFQEGFTSTLKNQASVTTATLTNNSEVEQQVSESHTFSYQTSSTTTLSTTYSYSFEVAFEVTAKFAKGSVKMGYTAGFTTTNSETVTTTTTNSYTFNVVVLPETTVYGECFASYYTNQVPWTGKANFYYNIGEPDIGVDVSGTLTDVDIADVSGTYHQIKN